MKAAQYTGNKGFSIVDGEKVSPKADEVCIQVGFAGICGTDMHIYHGVMDKRVSIPQTIGHEMSGTVAEVGEGVSDYAVGDRVVVRPLDYCDDCPACDAGHSHVCHNLKFMGVDTPGAFQSYWTVKARTLHRLPESVSLKQGALVEPLSVACHDVSRVGLKAGEKAVILGGGPIGQLIAAVAKSIGAEVMVSEVNSERLKFSRDLGVATVNPLEQDIEAVVKEWTAGKGADVVFEVSGVKAAVDTMTQIAAVRGRICMVAIHSQKPEVDLFQFFWKELELVGARVYEAKDFDQAIELISSKKISIDNFISSVAPLSQIGDIFSGIDSNPAGMKSLIDCGASE
ncbi:(R,R)-butanediol dehydrogenase [Gilvimarinus polysaccharolyticus]|uniref:(R,R)-butanediol dehydrogenase n=1 Tax=Gilvimarinus polysaccharolyticus TaxID=863921 RepID=UPI000673A7F1|nr:(R,R)-butanediol dehydrogenase [Gilvimarinus polysaccharolyticus]